MRIVSFIPNAVNEVGSLRNIYNIRKFRTGNIPIFKVIEVPRYGI